VSITTIGYALGVISSGPLSDKIGRRPLIMFGDVFFLSGSLMMCLAQNIQTVIGGRFVVGIGVGIALQMVPVYLSEMSPV